MTPSAPGTLVEALVRAAVAEPDKGLIFVDSDEREARYRWLDIDARAAAVAGGLRARGVRPGDTVAIVLPTGPLFFDAFFGVLLAGGVPVPLYPPIRLGRLDEYHGRTAAAIAAVRARLVLTDGRTWRILGEAVSRARPELGCVHLYQPERTAATIIEGWLETGDLAFLHDGELYVCGRAKDVVILRGRNHAPHEVEQAVYAVSGVRSGCAAAVGHRPEDQEEEQLLLFVETSAEHPELAARCRAAVAGATGLDPGLVVLLTPGTLPRTSSGKIRRGETLRRWLAGTLTAPETVTPWMLAGHLAKATLAHWRRSLTQ